MFELADQLLTFVCTVFARGILISIIQRTGLMSRRSKLLLASQFVFVELRLYHVVNKNCCLFINIAGIFYGTIQLLCFEFFQLINKIVSCY